MKQKALLITFLLLLSAMSSFADNISPARVGKICYSVNHTKLTARVIEPIIFNGQKIEYEGDIVIPETIRFMAENETAGADYVVTEIAIGAFWNDVTTSVSIPGTVDVIPEDCFRYCTNLRSVTIHYGVKRIGSSAFFGLKNLGSVYFDSAITPLTVGKGGCEIESDCFYDCKNLKNVALRFVTSIGDYAFFACYGLTSVTIGNSVTSIGEYAFSGCSGLTSLIIPNSVTSIGWGAFSVCGGLTSVTIPNSMTSISESAFSHCSSLTSVTIPNSVTSIGCGAFGDCESLTSVTIPNSVTSIGDEAFWYCIGLTSVTIPNSVTSIGDEAFWYCIGLTSVSIPNSVTSIGSGAFGGCESLTSITIPNSVTSIGESVFSACNALTSIIVEEGNTVYDSRNNCNAIIETATNTLIAGCKNTIIPNEVTSIGDFAFYHCQNLTSITIPESVTNIGMAAFMYCSGLTSLIIPERVSSIGISAFNSLYLEIPKLP